MQRLSKLLVLILLSLTPVAARADTDLPITHGSIVRNYARVTFEWPSPVYFTAAAKGKTITITFDRAANPDFGPLLAQLYPYVLHAERKSDGKTVVLTLDKPYRIRTFISDNVSGVDLLGIDANAREEARNASEEVQPDESKAHKLASLAPSAGEAKTVTAPPAAKPAEAPKPLVTAKAASDSDSAAIALEAAKNPVPPVANTAAAVKVNLSALSDSATLRFGFTERMAASVFVRTHMLWIVFNKPVTFDLSDFDSLPRTIIGKPEIISGTGGSVLRLPIDGSVYASAAKQDGSFEWAVLVTPKSRALTEALKVSVHTDPPAPPHVFIPVLEMAEPISVSDPNIGDELVVTPLFKAGAGVAAQRDFVEFSLLESAQGVVVSKKADDVAVAQVRDGLRIATTRGTTLTPGLPDIDQAAPAALQNAATLFPYDTWKLPASLARRSQLRELLHRVVESNNVQQANEARLRMAQIYLSEGLAPEAIAQLDGVNRTNPAFYRGSKLAAMHGAANFLMYRFNDAARDFGAAELNNNKEIDFWRSMLSDLLGNPGQYDYLALNDDYISKYPPIFRQRIAIVAADRSIGAKEYNSALKIFDTLHQANLLDPINSYVNFLLAKIAADTGQEQEALEMWDKLAEDSSHPFVQSRAEFSRVAWGLDHGTLTKEQVIDRLERLHMAWHGDNMELQVLSLLGDLYGERKDYINAMRIWENGVTSFANTAAAIEMSHKMEDAFAVMFSEGAADNLPTLDALTFYYQYRTFAPPGAGNHVVVERLADRLAAVDLLEQAAALLDHEMHFQTEKEGRSQLGAKLAGIHLLNHQPKKALQALQDSVYGNNTAVLRMQRNRLTAEALTDLGQSDKALQLVAQDDSADADRIRVKIYWQEKDWPRVIDGVETILKNRKDITAPLAVDESEYVIKLALAYVFKGDRTQLQYLRDYFGPLMVASKNKPVFDFITATDIAPQPTNFDDVMKYLADTRAFVDGYQAGVQTAGLESAKAPAAQPPQKATP